MYYSQEVVESIPNSCHSCTSWAVELFASFPTDSCPIEGQVSQSCGSACPPTCATPHPICTKQCVPGCQCPPGTVLDEVANKCVLLTKCSEFLCEVQLPYTVCGAVRLRYILLPSCYSVCWCCKANLSECYHHVTVCAGVARLISVSATIMLQCVLVLQG